MNHIISFRGIRTSIAAILAVISTATFAAGDAPRPTICNRACWDARAPSGSISTMGSLTRAIVHHSAGNEWNTGGLSDSKADVRAIQNFQMNSNGWSDVGYHYLIDKFGNIFEGRAGSNTGLPRGAHDADNTNSFGFCCMGYFHPSVNNVPSAALLDGLYDIIAWRMPSSWTPYGSPGGSYGELGNTIGRVDAHRRVKATACPGDGLYAYMGSNLSAGAIRSQIQARLNPAPPPPPGGTPVTHLAGWYRIVTQFNNKVFDVAGSSMDNAADIRQWTWNGSAAQIFDFDHLGDGYYRITNKNSGKVMDVAGQSSGNSANIAQYTWLDQDNQKWRVEDLGGGNYRLVAKHSGKVADVAGSGTTDGTNIQQYTWNGSAAQKFKLENIPVPITNLSGEYRIIKKGTDDKAIDLDHSGLENGVNIQLWSTNAGDAQVFDFALQSDGYYKITSRVSGKVWDVAGSSTAAGGNIQQYTWNGTDNQRWFVEDLGDGYRRITAKHSDLVVDAASNGTANGTNIQQWTWNGGTAQRWKIEKVGIPDTGLAGGYTINCKSGGMAVDVAGGGTVDGTNIRLYTPNGTTSQKFTFEHLGNGFYKIICQVSGKVWDLEGPSFANQADIAQWTWNGGANQKWRAEIMEDGSYRFLSQYSGKAVDAATVVSGGEVYQFYWTGGNNQRWLLTPVAGPVPPAAPTGLAATGVNTGQINLTWTDASADETEFVVARGTAPGGPYTDLATLAANTTSYSNTGLAANTTYYYVVRASNAGGDSPPSNEDSGVTWPNEIIVDNSDAGFAANANWSSGTSSADKYGADYRFRPTAAVTDPATWNVTLPQSRNYEVYAWWAQGTNRSAAAPYILPDNATVTANQQSGGGAWNSLGIKSLAAGATSVKLGCNATTGFVVVADAIRIVPR